MNAGFPSRPASSFIFAAKNRDFHYEFSFRLLATGQSAGVPRRFMLNWPCWRMALHRKRWSRGRRGDSVEPERATVGFANCNMTLSQTVCRYISKPAFQHVWNTRNNAILNEGAAHKPDDGACRDIAHRRYHHLYHISVTWNIDTLPIFKMPPVAR